MWSVLSPILGARGKGGRMSQVKGVSGDVEAIVVKLVAGLDVKRLALAGLRAAVVAVVAHAAREVVKLVEGKGGVA